MIYLNKNLQESYSRLWSKFRSDVFSFQEASENLKRKKPASLNILSQMKRRGWLIVVGREGYKRIYRLLEPNDAIFALANINNLERIKNIRYTPIIIKTCRQLFYKLGCNLHSIVLYGSIARGDATFFSDVDLLIVADNTGKNLGERLNFLYKFIGESEQEIKFLARYNIFSKISLFPLTKLESKRFIPLYLDISQEGIILFDRDEFFKKNMMKVNLLLSLEDVKKKYVGKQYYWKMNPEKEFGVIA